MIRELLETMNLNLVDIVLLVILVLSVVLGLFRGLLGVVFGALRGIILLAVIVLVVNMTSWAQEKMWQQSKAVQYIHLQLLHLRQYLPSSHVLCEMLSSRASCEGSS